MRAPASFRSRAKRPACLPALLAALLLAGCTGSAPEAPIAPIASATPNSGAEAFAVEAQIGETAVPP
jgi:outer membrane PBP1 activator LpoA protein